MILKAKLKKNVTIRVPRVGGGDPNGLYSASSYSECSPRRRG